MISERRCFFLPVRRVTQFSCFERGRTHDARGNDALSLKDVRFPFPCPGLVSRENLCHVAGKKEPVMYYTMSCPSPLGELTLAGDEEHIVGLWLEGQKYFAATLKGKPTCHRETPVLALAHAWLERYFAGERPSPSELPLAPEGSAFRLKVWKALCDIPYGEVTTYGNIAARLSEQDEGKACSPRAVGGAVGHNPVSIIIPCHRVVGTGGSLTGYAGGLERKILLLQREGVDVARFRIPAAGSAL